MMIVLSYIPKLSKKLVSKVHKRLRFSISFKMTTVYTLIFSIILFFISTALIIGFRFFLLNHVEAELAEYSLVAINYARLEKDFSSLNISAFSNIKNVTTSVFDEKEVLIYRCAAEKTPGRRGAGPHPSPRAHEKNG